MVVDARGVTVLFNQGEWVFGDALTLLDDSQSLFAASHAHFRLSFMDVEGDGACAGGKGRERARARENIL